MPVATSLPPIFPPTTRSELLAFQFSRWYPRFASLSVKSTVIRPLSTDFRAYLNVDGVYVPAGSEDVPAESTLSDEDADEEEEEEQGPRFAFPDLDREIRAVIKEYGAVFPKLNFSSPRDAAWMLPASSPLKCTSPADVYLLLKSSDFVSHDLDHAHVFDGCVDDSRPPDDTSPEADTAPASYELELVLRKWYPVERSRELRCFVRQGKLIGISQRDPNYYDFLNEPATRETIIRTVRSTWETSIRDQWAASRDYTFDVLLTRDLARLHILDFNPYLPRTDPLLFTYPELLDILLALLAPSPTSPSADADPDPELRVVDSRAHPTATRNAPDHQHNMVPLDALRLGSGQDIEAFAELWREEVRKGMGSENEDE